MRSLQANASPPSMSNRTARLTSADVEVDLDAETWAVPPVQPTATTVATSTRPTGRPERTPRATPLPLRTGKRDALNELPLEDEEDDDQRERAEHRTRHDQVPDRSELLLEQREPERQGVQ